MQKVDSRKIALVVLFVLILAVLALFIGKFTYSYLGPDISDDQSAQGEVTASGDTLIFSKGNGLALSVSLDNFNSNSGNLSASTNPSVKLVANAKTNNATATYYSGIYIYENSYTYSTTEKTAELILTVRDETGTIISNTPSGLKFVTVNGVSGFDITGKTGPFTIVSDKQITTTSSTTGTTHTWTYTLTFVNLATDQSINENAKFDAEVAHAKSEISFASICEKGTIACEIANKYTTDGENNLYYHDGNGEYANSNLEAKDKSYRYSGANPDNWVCFGSSEEDCPYDNLYRIIGVFNENIKIIKHDYANSSVLGDDGCYKGGYSWEIDTYKGELSASELDGYYWSQNSDNFDKSGLYISNLNINFLNKIGSEWSNKISEKLWFFPKLPTDATGANVYYAYTEEHSDIQPSSVNKIGLMYASEYAYASDPEYWSVPLGALNGSAKEKNWMYMGLYEWTMNGNSTTSNGAFYLSYLGGFVATGTKSGSGLLIRPTLYLNRDIKITGGTGTSTDPYKIA